MKIRIPAFIFILLGVTITTSGIAEQEIEGMFVIAVCKETLTDEQRIEKYDRPLEEKLRKYGYGRLADYRSQLTSAFPEEFTFIPIDLKDSTEALIYIRSEMKALGAPMGSFVLFYNDGVEHMRPLLGRKEDWKEPDIVNEN